MKHMNKLIAAAVVVSMALAGCGGGGEVPVEGRLSFSVLCQHRFGQICRLGGQRKRGGNQARRRKKYQGTLCC